ncbi:dihydrodipicolinate synthase family protein [Cupriavidus sp. CV2]|uniref:dihydrodipicolinate synthase family protein n=1 Tax=Cupriavidus ulmosensis TaxID=3065913 RepID=UPI00296B3BAD|nr:dihydrodipicolinate synthase family protein [Cupriavidus sp. CV2]MDW3687582.1 dihydrodipicolinate synthase family protein [Cupriavidus sp. CV2]
MTQASGGLWVPTSTPFAPNGSVDRNLFLTHCKALLDEGADGLAILGTTSEANSLSVSERADQLDLLIDNDISPSKLMPGTGACSIEDAVQLTSAATNAGCAGVLLLPPFYYKGLSEDGLFAFLSELIERVGAAQLRLYLYHIPPVAQIGYSLPLIERLLKRYPNTIAGLKDSSGDFDNTLAVIRNFPQLHVFPGSETFLLDGLRAGAAGCISATGNINAKAIKEVYVRWKEPNADRLQAAITRRRKLVEAYPLIPAVKAVLAARYGDSAWNRVRAPLQSLDGDRASELTDQLAKDGLARATTGVVA